MKGETDFIEIGKGNQSKVIGHNNTISEMGATALSVVTFAGKGGMVAFLVMWLLLYIAGYTIFWAMGIALSLSIALTMTFVYALVTLILHLQRIATPPQMRDENGRFVARDTPLSEGGKYLGRFVYDESGNSAYLPAETEENGQIIRWGGGGDRT